MEQRGITPEHLMKRKDIDIRHPRKCRCGNIYFRFSTLQNKCVKCLVEKGKKIAEKEKRKEIRQRKEKLKSRSEHMEEAQEVFNFFIRLRDKNEPCISCGTWNAKWDAGHFRSVGSAPELRFEELNVHKQCFRCNGPLGSNRDNYEAALIRKIGQEKVDWLKGPHAPKKYTIEELKALKNKYRVMTRALKWVVPRETEEQAA